MASCAYLWRTRARPLRLQTRGTGSSCGRRTQRNHLRWREAVLQSQFGCKRQKEVRGGGGVTSQVGGAVGVGQPGPRVSALEPVVVAGALVAGALVPPRGPLDHHEQGHGAVFKQRPRQGHAGAVDDPHAEGAHAAAWKKMTCIHILYLSKSTDASVKKKNTLVKVLNSFTCI